MKVIKNDLVAQLPASLAHLVSTAERTGKRIYTVSSYAEVEPYICPSFNGVLSVEYLNYYGKPFGESTVTNTAFGHKRGDGVFNINFTSPALQKRPTHPRSLTWGADGVPTCQPHSLKSAYGLDFEELWNLASEWLAGKAKDEQTEPDRTDLLLFAACAGKGRTRARILFVIPKSSAWQAAAAGLLHRLIPLEEGLERGFDAVVQNAPGLRDTHFEGQAASTYSYGRDGVLRVLVNNTYPGGSLKKLILTVLSVLLTKKGRHAHHASISVVERKSGARWVTLYSANSGGGKTESSQVFHLNDQNVLLMTEWFNGTFVVNFSSDDMPLTRFVAGDDIVVFEELQKGHALNFEQGAFNRTNAATKRGDLPMEELILERAERDVLTFNYDALPGEKLEIWHHQGWQGENRHTNPRIIYANSKVPGYIDTPLKVDCFMMGVPNMPYARTTKIVDAKEQEVTEGFPLGALHIQARANFALMYYLGIQRVKSVSTDGVEDGMGTSGFGYMSSFTLSDRWALARAIFGEMCCIDVDTFAMVPVGYLGTREIGYRAEQSGIEILARKADGAASFSLFEPADALLGAYATRIQMGENYWPEGMEVPSSQSAIGQSGFIRMSRNVRRLAKQEFELLLAEVPAKEERDDLDLLILELVRAGLSSKTTHRDYEALSRKMVRLGMQIGPGLELLEAEGARESTWPNLA